MFIRLLFVLARSYSAPKGSLDGTFFKCSTTSLSVCPAFVARTSGQRVIETLPGSELAGSRIVPRTGAAHKWRHLSACHAAHFDANQSTAARQIDITGDPAFDLYSQFVHSGRHQL